jgi:RNA polymerase-binding transcription factor DksA
MHFQLATDPPFSPAELAIWRQRLIDQARSLSADVVALDGDTVLAERVAPNYHLAESAAELQAAGIGAAAADEEQRVLRLVLRAITKIDTSEPGVFGLCELTGARIEPERLELMPWTPFCAAASAHFERLGVGVDDASLSAEADSGQAR